MGTKFYKNKDITNNSLLLENAFQREDPFTAYGLFTVNTSTLSAVIGKDVFHHIHFCIQNCGSGSVERDGLLKGTISFLF